MPRACRPLEGRPTRTIGCLLVILILFSGCFNSSAPEPIKTKYADADRRFGQAVDGGFSDLRQIVVPRSASALTVRASFLSDQGIAFTFRNPDGNLVRSLSFPTASSAREIHWVEASAPKPGTWRFGVTCTHACTYAFGFYFRDAVVKADDIASRYSDATKRFADESEGATKLVREFIVPEDVHAIGLKWSAHGAQGFSFAVRDPTGVQHAPTTFTGHAAVDDLQTLLVSSPPAGTWTFSLECRTMCSYAYGFYLDP